MQTLAIDRHRSLHAHTSSALVVMALLLSGGCQRAIEIVHDLGGGSSPPSQPKGAGGSGAGGSSAGAAAASTAGAGGLSGPDQCAAEGGKCILGGASCNHRGTSDCNPTRNPGGAFCCLDEASSAMCTDAGSVEIAPANYDQTCSSASDCVAVPAGDVCFPCIRACTAGVVNTHAVASYRADISTAVGTSDPPDVRCNCPAEFSPCCLAGQCHAGPECQSTGP